MIWLDWTTKFGWQHFVSCEGQVTVIGYSKTASPTILGLPGHTGIGGSSQVGREFSRMGSRRRENLRKCPGHWPWYCNRSNLLNVAWCTWSIVYRQSIPSSWVIDNWVIYLSLKCLLPTTLSVLESFISQLGLMDVVTKKRCVPCLFCIKL